MNRKERYAQWGSVIARYESSGQNQREFCTSNNISFRKFKYYRYRLQLASRKKTFSSEISKQTFMPIKVKPEPTVEPIVKSHCKIILPNSIEVHFPLSSQRLITHLIKELNGC